MAAPAPAADPAAPAAAAAAADPDPWRGLTTRRLEPLDQGYPVTEPSGSYAALIRMEGLSDFIPPGHGTPQDRFSHEFPNTAWIGRDWGPAGQQQGGGGQQQQQQQQQPVRIRGNEGAWHVLRDSEARRRLLCDLIEMCELEEPGDDWVRDRGLRHYGQALYGTFNGSRKAFLEQTLEWAQSWFQVRVRLLQHYGRDIWGGPSRATAFTADLSEWALQANAAIHEPHILDDAQFARAKGSAAPGEDRSVRVKQLYSDIYSIDADYASRLGALVTNADGRGTPNLQDIFSWLIRFINRYHLWLKVVSNATRWLPPTRTQSQGSDFYQEFQGVRRAYQTVLAHLDLVVGEREATGRVQLATFARLRTACLQLATEVRTHHVHAVIRTHRRGMDDYEKCGNIVVRPIAGFPNLTPNRIPTLGNESRPASDFPQGDNSDGDDGSDGDGGGGNGPGIRVPAPPGQHPANPTVAASTAIASKSVAAGTNSGTGGTNSSRGRNNNRGGTNSTRGNNNSRGGANNRGGFNNRGGHNNRGGFNNREGNNNNRGTSRGRGTGGRGRGPRGSGRGAGNAGGSIYARAAVIVGGGSDRTTSSRGSISDGSEDNGEASGNNDSDSDRASNPDNSSGVLYSEVSDTEDRRSQSGDDQEELGDLGSYEITDEQEQNMMANTNFFEPSFRRNMCDGWKRNLYIQSILAEAEANNTGSGPTALFDPDEKPTHLPEFSPNKRRRLGPKFRPHNVYAPFQFLARPS
ncbi:hypothetical protein DL768_004878 [Monosporascus sp. mg162]|nr:hypothetical protein DL768_004878 [Monosporascus sp. mg162]